MIKSVRIQRKRTKGFNLQEHSRSINGLDCVCVDRSNKTFGNPYKVGEKSPYPPFEPMTASQAVTCYALDITINVDYGFDIYKWIAPLKGKNLACWCPLDQPCHVDVLVDLVNNDAK